MKIILEGIVGSRAYGLDTPESDTDIKGIFVYPTIDMLKLYKQKQTINSLNPDLEYHEIEKFMLLASKCNPTILELLYLKDYNILLPEGKLLVDNRYLFLSKQVLKTYGGYALAQAKKLYHKGMAFARYEKHSRHCFRLLIQGEEILRTHSLTVKLEPKIKEKLFSISKLSPEKLIEEFEKEFKKFDEIPTTLPEKPELDKLNNILLKIRKINYERK